MLMPAGPASALPSAPAAQKAGTGIGNAAQLTSTAAGSVAAGSDDWWVIYPRTAGGTVQVTVADKDSGSCAVKATLDSTNGTGGQLSAKTIGAGAATALSGQAVASDRYYVEVQPSNCSSAAPYKLTLNAGGGGKAPNPAAGSARPGTGITVWPPLRGHTRYTRRLSAGALGDWYVLYKKAGTTAASVRIENNTPPSSGACSVAFAVYSSFGPGQGSDAVATAIVGENGAVTVPIPATEPGDSAGRYFVSLASYSCASVRPVYSVEPEPGAQWYQPTRTPTGTLHPAGDPLAAGPPLRGGISYQRTEASDNTNPNFEWYVLYKKQDSRPASVWIQDDAPQITSPDGDGSCEVDVTLVDGNGIPFEKNTLDLFSDSSGSIAIPATEPAAGEGRYFLRVDAGCSGPEQSGHGPGIPATMTYSIEPQPAAEWAAPARPPSRPLPAGPSKKAAGGPLAGNVNYTTSLKGTSQHWAFFRATGKKPVTVQVANLSRNNGQSCKTFHVVLENAAGAVQASSTNGGLLWGIRGAGRYYLHLSTGCRPAVPLKAAVLLLSGPGGL
jgi:hypothetical protein